MNQPDVKIKYAGPSMPSSGVHSQDDVDGVLRSNGLLKTTTHAGSVTVGGAPDFPFPFAWSSSKQATGQYRITHNLGHAHYVVVAVPAKVTASSDTVITNITTKTATYCDITFSSTTGLAIDQYFEFILVETTP